MLLLRLLFRLSFGLGFYGLIVNVFRTRVFIPLKTCHGYLFVNCYSFGEISNLISSIYRFLLIKMHFISGAAILSR